MDSKNELLLAVREAKKYLREGTDIRVTDVLAVFESIAPFLDKQAIVKMKCQGCDNFSRASFPLDNDLCAVESSDYCHAKSASLKNLATLKLAGCAEYSPERAGGASDSGGRYSRGGSPTRLCRENSMTERSLPAIKWTSRCRLRLDV